MIKRRGGNESTLDQMQIRIRNLIPEFGGLDLDPMDPQKIRSISIGSTDLDLDPRGCFF